MLQPTGSIMQIAHVVDDIEAAVVHWTGTLGDAAGGWDGREPLRAFPA